MPFQKISGNFVELSVDNYIGTIRAGGTVSDLGFKTYKESNVGQAPVSGTGGSPGISLSLNTTAPLSSDADLRLVKDSTNRQGEGFAVDFTIQNRHIAKVLQISFDTELISGTYTNPSPIQSGTFTVVSTTCTITANHSLIAGQSVYVNFPGGASPVSGQYVITSVVAGVSFAFTVASGSGTGVACTWQTRGSLRVYIIQNPTTSPIVIEPVNTDIQYGIANQKIKHIASFQTGAVGTSYRLIIHVGNNSTNGFTVDFANFKIWETTQSIGSVITDWQSYTPTFTNCGTVTGVDVKWRRVGGSIQVRGVFTTGIIVNALQTFTLPNGLIPDLNWTSGNGTLIGYITRNISGENNTNSLIGRNTNLISIGGNIAFSTGSNNPLATPNNNFIGSNELQNFYLETPIQGWGSSVAMSSDTGDGRVVVARYTGWVAQALTASSTRLRFSTLSYDTHSSYNNSTGVFTAPISGYYRWSFVGRFDFQARVDIYVNNTFYESSADLASPSPYNNLFSGQVFLVAGQTLDFRTANSGNATATGGITSFSIERISSGSQIIASSETVACKYTSNNGQIISATYSTLIYEDIVFDTHGAYNITTGRFTAPMSGKYLVHCTGNTGQPFVLGIKKNSTTSIFFDSTLVNYSGQGTIVPSVLTSIIDLNAGDNILIASYSSPSANLNASNSNLNQLSITRLGL
jgi:hypothetical protein